MPKCDGLCNVQVKSDPITRVVTSSADIQTYLSEVVHSSSRLFATHLNHKLSLYVSPVPDQNALDIDALNINWSGLVAYAYPPMVLLHRVSQEMRQLPHHTNSPRLARDALVLGPSAALNGNPTPTTGINKTSQTAPQSSVSQQPTIPEPTCLVSRSGLPPRIRLHCGSGREICCPSRTVRFGEFLHSLCKTSLRLFHVSVLRLIQVPINHSWL